MLGNYEYCKQIYYWFFTIDCVFAVDISTEPSIILNTETLVEISKMVEVKNRIDLPWKVYFQNNHAAVTRYRDGREAKTTFRYFETKSQALIFANGNERRVLYRPGEAYYYKN